MSRIGKQPIEIPSGVTVTINGPDITVTGPKGSLSRRLYPAVKVTHSGNQLVIERTGDEAVNRAQHGLTRALLANMVQGVSQGYERKLEIHGVGYRAQAQADSLKFNLGYSHDVAYKIPAGITVNIDQNTVTVSGIDKQQVGQVAAEIRSLRKPEPYKGKGIRYADEQIIRKSGKSTKE